MRRPSLTLAAVLLGTLAITVPGSQSLAVADAPPGRESDGGGAPGSSAGEPFSPQQHALQALRKQAVEEYLTGSQASTSSPASPPSVARGRSKVRIGRDHVELKQERTARVFVILAEFGDQVDNTTMHGGKVKYGGTPGPLHNAIAKPDPTADNHTLWRHDFDRAYYQNMFFSTAKGANSVRNYFQIQSAGRFDIDGSVSDWVKLPWNEARYGSNFYGGRICDNGHDLIRDAVTAWYDGERAKGRSTVAIRAELATFDAYDRYDFDKDGEFAEPDGYLDAESRLPSCYWTAI